jgi:hypothetical protein
MWDGFTDQIACVPTPSHSTSAVAQTGYRPSWMREDSQFAVIQRRLSFFVEERVISTQVSLMEQLRTFSVTWLTSRHPQMATEGKKRHWVNGLVAALQLGDPES